MVAIGIMYHEGFVGSVCDPMGSAEDISQRLYRTFSVVFDTILLVQDDRVVMQLNKGVDYHVEPVGEFAEFYARLRHHLAGARRPCGQTAKVEPLLPDKLALPQITRTTKTSGELG